MTIKKGLKTVKVAFNHKKGVHNKGRITFGRFYKRSNYIRLKWHKVECYKMIENREGRMTKKVACAKHPRFFLI